MHNEIHRFTVQQTFYPLNFAIAWFWSLKWTENVAFHLFKWKFQNLWVGFWDNRPQGSENIILAIIWPINQAKSKLGIQNFLHMVVNIVFHHLKSKSHNLWTIFLRYWTLKLQNRHFDHILAHKSVQIKIKGPKF